jgi:hypothetical protein
VPTIDNRRRRDGLARNPKKDRSDVAGGGRDRRHSEQERERLDTLHLENEWKHEGESYRPAEARQDAHGKTDGDPDKHQADAFPGKHQEETLDEGLKHLERHN